jgi:hypothetical protein
MTVPRKGGWLGVALATMAVVISAEYSVDVVVYDASSGGVSRVDPHHALPYKQSICIHISCTGPKEILQISLDSNIWAVARGPLAEFFECESHRVPTQCAHAEWNCHRASAWYFEVYTSMVHAMPLQFHWCNMSTLYSCGGPLVMHCRTDWMCTVQVIAAVAAARHGARTLLICASWPACHPEGGLRVSLSLVRGH